MNKYRVKNCPKYYYGTCRQANLKCENADCIIKQTANKYLISVEDKNEADYFAKEILNTLEIEVVKGGE